MSEKSKWIRCNKCGKIHWRSDQPQEDLEKIKAQGTHYEGDIKDFCPKCKVVTWHKLNDPEDLRWCPHCGNTQFYKTDKKTDVESFRFSMTFGEWKNIKSFNLECTQPGCHQKFDYDLRSGKVTEGKMTKKEKEEQVS